VPRAALGTNQGPFGALVSRAIGQLCRETPPAPGDFETFVPPEPGIWSRRLGTGLWLLYSFDDRTVTILNLLKSRDE
jgi:Txe/YoeB family toxin of Txe-Axe toxin-antitoxin module